jgi:hypothetical protein
MTLARFCEMYCLHNGIKVSETKFACIGLDINFDFLIGVPHEIRKAGIWQEWVEKNKGLKKIMEENI